MTKEQLLEQKGALECQRCDRVFIHKGRGRKPFNCPECREIIAEEARFKPAEPVQRASKKIAIPILEKVTRFDIEEGDMLYFVSHMFATDISRRRFASQWRVKEIGDEQVTMQKISTKEVVTGHLNDRFYKQVGTEYIEAADDNAAEKED